MHADRSLSDADLARLIRARADELDDGDRDRAALLVELLELLVDETDAVIDAERHEIGSRGRVSFGRANAGLEGTAVFLPSDVTAAVDQDHDQEGSE